jgi:hypothetical protein
MSEGVGVREVLLLLFGLGAMGWAWYLARTAPRLVVAGWTAVCFFVPIWVGVQAGVYFSAVAGATLVALAGWFTGRLTFSSVDLLFGAFLCLVLIAFAFGGATWGHLLIVLFGWLLPYVWGRVVLVRVPHAWLSGCIAVAATVAAVLGILEFATGFNPFLQIVTSNPGWLTWHELQLRGGFVRAEGAFGHSIAYAGALAMGSVFVITTRWPAWIRLACLAVIVTAVGLSFSRIGLVSLALTLLLAVLLLGRWIEGWVRAGVAALLVAAAAIGVPMLWDVFTAAGDEAGGSAAYRSELIPLLGDLRPIVIAPSWAVLPTGETYYGTFQSIDSELVLTALRFGYLPLLALVAALVVCIVSLLKGRATPAAVAVAAQVPAFAAVALLTQFGFLVWFLAGVAVSSVALHEAERRGSSEEASAPPEDREIGVGVGARAVDGAGAVGPAAPRGETP